MLRELVEQGGLLGPVVHVAVQGHQASLGQEALDGIGLGFDALLLGLAALAALVRDDGSLFGLAALGLAAPLLGLAALGLAGLLCPGTTRPAPESARPGKSRGLLPGFVCRNSAPVAVAMAVDA